MHSAAVESYLLICNAIEQEKSTSGTRKFDTCQTKGCCSRVQDSKALRRLLICTLLKSERRIEDGVLDRAQPESLNFWLVWHGHIDHSGRLHNALRVASLFAVRVEGISLGLHHLQVQPC